MMLNPDRVSLTSCICETCSQRDDISTEIEEVIRGWLKLSERDQITITFEKQTLH